MTTLTTLTLLLACLAGLVLIPLREGAAASPAPDAAPPEGASSAPPLGALVNVPASELRDVVERYSADRSALFRRYDVDYSPARRQRLREFYAGWRARLAELDFDRLSEEGRIDYLLLD